MSLFLVTIGLFLLHVNLGDAQAQPSEADVALLAAACSGCHSKTQKGFPQIYGRPAAEVQEALVAFREDKREGTVMNRIAKGYSEEEIGLLSHYLAAQDPAN